MSARCTGSPERVAKPLKQLAREVSAQDVDDELRHCGQTIGLVIEGG